MFVKGWLCAVLMSGCLLPQNEPVITDTVPVPVNRPPSILDESADPDPYTELDGTTECSLMFSATVTDPDDTLLRVRWYIDWSPSNTAAFKETTTLLTSNKVGEKIELPINLDSAANPFRFTGTYVLELLVSDGELVGRQPLSETGPDGGLITPRYSDVHAWFINVTSTDCATP